MITEMPVIITTFIIPFERHFTTFMTKVANVYWRQQYLFVTQFVVLSISQAGVKHLKRIFIPFPSGCLLVETKRSMRVLGRYIGISRQVRLLNPKRANLYVRIMHMEGLIAQFFEIFCLLRYKWPKRPFFSDWRGLGSNRGHF